MDEVLRKLTNLGFERNIALKAVAVNGGNDFQTAANWIISHANDPLLKQTKDLNYVVLLSFSPQSLYIQHILKQIQNIMSTTENPIPSTCDIYFSLQLTPFFKISNDKVKALQESFYENGKILKAIDDLQISLEPIIEQDIIGCRLNDTTWKVLEAFAESFHKFLETISDFREPESKPQTIFPFILTKDFPISSQCNVTQRVKGLVYALSSKTNDISQRNSTNRSSDSERLNLVVNLLSFEDEVGQSCVYLRTSKRPISCLLEALTNSEPRYQEQSGDVANTAQPRFLPPTTTYPHDHEMYYGNDTEHSGSGRINGPGEITVVSCQDGLPYKIPSDSLERIPKICAWNVIGTINVPTDRRSMSTSLSRTEIDGAPNRQNRILSKIDFYRAYTRCQFSELNSSDYSNWYIAQPQYLADFQKEKYMVKRRYIIARHGERTDQAFGHHWTHEVFKEANSQFYQYKDLNIPRILPKHEHGPDDLLVDSPLSEIGMFEAYLTGDYMKKVKLFETINWVYSSPALRSIQTAHFILKGLGLVDVLKIRVDTVLFEWYGYIKHCPCFMEPRKLKDCGFNIDLNYKSMIPEVHYDPNETLEHYYARGEEFMRKVSEHHKDQAGDILIVGHGGTLEVNTRGLLGRRMRDWNQFNLLLQSTPYCATTQLNEMPDGGWEFTKIPPGLPMSYLGNKPYDWTILLD